MWGILRVKYKERLEQGKQAKQQSGVVNMPDGAICEKYEEMARHFTLHCGQAWADAGDTEDFLDQSRHNIMVEALNLVKKFAIEKPQFNSYAGMFDMVDDDDFKVKMGLIIALCYDERGPQTDTIAESVILLG